MDILQYTFFQHALLGSLLASIACGIIGTYIVTRRLVFISGGLTHASFGGIGIGLYTGVSPLLSASVFAVLSAFGVEWLSKRKDMREDSAIAVFWALGMAVGVIFTFLSPGFAPDLSAYLFGNILTITRADLLMLAVVALALAVFFALFRHPIVYVAFDREFARSQGLPVRLFEYLLMLFIALTIVACLRIVGIAAHRGHRPGHLVADHPADDGQPVLPPFPPHHRAVRRHRLCQLLVRAWVVLPVEHPLRGVHHLLLHPHLCRMQGGEEFVDVWQETERRGG